MWDQLIKMLANNPAMLRPVLDLIFAELKDHPIRITIGTTPPVVITIELLATPPLQA